VSGALTEGSVTIAIKVTDKDGLTFQENIAITVTKSASSAVLENLGWYAYADTNSGSTKANSTLTGGKGELDFEALFATGKIRCDFNLGTADDKGTTDENDDVYPTAVLCVDTLRNSANAVLSLANSNSITITYKSDQPFKFQLPSAGTGYDEFSASLPSTLGIEKSITLTLNSTTFTQEGWGTVVSFNKANFKELNFVPTAEGVTSYIEISSISIDKLDDQLPVLPATNVTSGAMSPMLTGISAQTISLSAPKAGMYTVALYGVNGRLIHTSTAQLIAGQNSISWEGASAATTMAIVRVSGNGFMTTQKCSIK